MGFENGLLGKKVVQTRERSQPQMGGPRLWKPQREIENGPRNTRRFFVWDRKRPFGCTKSEGGGCFKKLIIQ